MSLFVNPRQEYEECLAELEQFSTQTTVTKQSIITRLRDSTLALIKARELDLKPNQTCAHVWSQLEARKVTVAKSWFLTLFDETLKRNYTKSSVESFHDHEWDLVHTAHGDWERCSCGANRLNGISQVDTEPRTTAPAKDTQVIEPVDVVEYEIIQQLEIFCKLNLQTLRLMKSKLIYNKTQVLKQKHNAVDEIRDERIEEAQDVIRQRLAIVKKQMAKLAKPSPERFLRDLKKTIALQVATKRHFDDRLKITYFEKAMAHLAVNIGFEKNEIARWLGITSKHMKMSVLTELYSDKESNVLKALDWFGRCPNPDCGISLKDYYESKIGDFQQGKPISEAEDYEIELLKPSGYQAQVIKLKRRLSK